MKFLLLVHHNETNFAAMSDTVKRDLLAESVQLTHDLHARGQYVHASPLMPSATGARVRGVRRQGFSDRWPVCGNA